MESSRSHTDAGIDFVQQAEALIRSLAGVVHARIHTTPGGIDAIHVLATDDDAAASMAGHVRSALLAGLATPVVPARIHVRTGSAPGTSGARTDHEDEHGPAAAAHDRLRLVHGEPELDEGNGHRAHHRTATPGAAAAPGAPAPTPAHVREARLVAVDVRKPAEGRLVCRVSIAWNGEVHRAEAAAVDLPGAAAQAAAQAAVRALASAGLDGLELSGLREVEIAGKDYVLVALRREDGPVVRHRSGSALMFGTPERSAAEAAVDAANELT